MPLTRAQRLSDPGRVAALRRLELLDTPAEEAFDRLTRLVARLLRAPIALVNLIDEERQFFKSAVGMGALRELPVGTGVCSYALASGEPLVIGDARVDPELSANRIVCDYGLVAYLGIPLVTSEGYALGTFCVVDTEPRTWTLADVETVGDLAAAAMAEIELRASARREERRAQELREALEELRRAGEETRASEERFQLVARATNDVLWEQDWTTGRLWWSERFTACFGYPPAEVGSDFASWESRVHPDDRERVVEGIASTLERGDETWSAEYRFRHADGSYLHVLDRGCFVYDAEHRPLRVVGSIMDITPRRRAEDAQRLLARAGAVLASPADHGDRLRLIAELVVPVLADRCLLEVVEEDGRIERTGADARTPPGAPAGEDAPHLADALELELAERVRRTGEPLLLPVAAGEPADGEPRGDRSAVAVPLVARGRCMGALVLLSAHPGRTYDEHDLALAGDVADRAALALDNARLFRAASRATAAREEILAVVSHELRNPLNAVLLVVDTLLEYHAEPVSPRLRKQLETVRGSADQMRRLVQDLLDVTRIKTGHLGVHPLVQGSADLVDEAVRMLRPLADARSVQVESRVPRSLPPVLADRQRVLQVLSNLVGNAIGHAPRGSTVFLDAVAAEGEVRFSVTDTGPGIAKEHLPHIFNPFWRAREEEGGLGLGLAIARGIVEAHGGKVWAGSAQGGGTVFHFSLPTCGPAAGSAAPGAEEDPAEAEAASPRFVDLHPRDTGLAPERAVGEDGRGSWRAQPFAPGAADGARQPTPAEVAGHLRSEIVGALHLGYLRPGDRLPSIRQMSRELQVPFHAVVRAYEELAGEGLVEKRERSGVFVARQDRPGGELMGETARWVQEVLVGALQHRIKVPRLPELIRRLTAAVPVRCVCIESTDDHRVALCAEMGQLLGFSAQPLAVADLPAPGAAGAEWPEEILRADLLVTTAYHGSDVRRVAEAAGKPLVVSALCPEVVAAVEQHLAEGELTVVCADPAFGDRVRALFGGSRPDRVRVVRADDAPAVEALDRSRPVLLTRAASERLSRTDLRLLVPLSPTLSPECLRTLAEFLVRFNMEDGRA